MSPPWNHRYASHHSQPAARLQDYPAGCLWTQFQWEREQGERDGGVSGEYLTSLETEWSRRDLCSRCLRDLDHPFIINVDELRHSGLAAQGKLARICGALSLLSDGEFRPTLSAILAEPVA